MPKKYLALAIALTLVVASYPLFFLRGESAPANLTATAGTAEVTLEFWGLWDSSDAWQTIISRFEQAEHIWNGQNVKVHVVYTKKDIGTYEAELEKAYAENKSPSAFLISNNWTARYAPRLEPLSNKVADITRYDLLDYEKLTDIYPPYILKDAFVGDDKMYAVPLYSDSLALYYNKDLFAKAGVAQAPTTWDELKADAKKLTLLGKNAELRQAGVTLGTGKNIGRSSDILALLILQSGGKVIDAGGITDINKTVSVNTSAGIRELEPGLNAIRFYSEFSDPNKEVYAWNSAQKDSLKAFTDGHAAMMFGFGYQRTNITAAKPKFAWGIAPVPQMPGSTPIDISNYWFPAVSNQKSCLVTRGQAASIDCAKIAWSFLSFAAQKENVAEYLGATDKAAARIDLLAQQAGSESDVAVFAKQASITRSYNRFDDRIDSILSDLLDAVASNREGWKLEADHAAGRIEEIKQQ